MLRPVALAGIVTASLFSVAASSPPGGCQSSGTRGTCWVDATDPGKQGTKAPSGQKAAGPKSTSGPQCAPMEMPQPAAGDPLWAGRDPGKGKLVAMVCGIGGPGGGFVGDVRVAYVPSGGVPVPQVSPAELAQRAIEQMNLSAPDIRLAPPADSPHGATIGFPVWMWSGRSEATTGPVTRTASAGAITVTATAKLARITWSMGDGISVTCTSPGTPFTDARAGEPSPDCGHTYRATAPGGAVTVAATSRWQISWSGGGQADSQVMDLPSSTQLPVREIRTLNTDGG
ncbi:hypothetical protein [Amycolatopsis magusensis]|uniref:hypothetical protein n=1 Tax=Amycolatopsis magusensis TaxID=882444 RepID=UPI0037A0884B